MFVLTRLSLLLAFSVLSVEAYGQSTGAVTLNATLAEQITMTATPSTVNILLNQGTTSIASVPVVISTAWLLLAGRSNVKLFGWFTTPAAALTDGLATPTNIASSQVLGKVLTGLPTSYTPFTQTNAIGTAGGGLLLFNQAITSLNRFGLRADNLSLEVDLTSQPQLPAGAYAGVLNLQAQVF